jgi:hypothetical protein
MESFGSHHSGAEPDDPAVYAGQVITDEVLAILHAVRARAVTIGAGARREAGERRGTATRRALVELEAISDHLHALAGEVDEKLGERAERPDRGA